MKHPSEADRASSGSMKLLVVLGTRPEVIKLAPLVLVGRKDPSISIILCSTGQHRELTRDALAAFGLTADIDLDVMTPTQTLSLLTSVVLDRVGTVIDDVRPDWVVVQGDTTSAFASALAAFYRRTPVAHVEAGLRTGDIYSPWPEEMNRRLISELAGLHFAPTRLAANNLEREGIPSNRVVVTGNTVIDALELIRRRLESDPEFHETAIAGLRAAGLDPERLREDRLILVTGHRRESFGAPLRDICRGLAAAAAEFPDHQFVFPLHPNPSLRSIVNSCFGGDRPANLKLIEPLAYVPFVALMLKAGLFITDSGGMQEEGVSLGRRVVVIRDFTERTEGIGLGFARLAGTSPEGIIRETREGLQGTWLLPSTIENPYGDGTASLRIITELHQRAFEGQ